MGEHFDEKVIEVNERVPVIVQEFGDGVSPDL